MVADDIIYLFKNYLGREPSLGEIADNMHKEFRVLRNEIINCKERQEYEETFNKVHHSNGVRDAHANQKIRIALLISGHIRKNSILQNLYDYLGFYDIDVFIFTWDNIGLKGNETKLDDVTDLDAVNKTILEFPNVRKFKIENNKKYIESIEEETLKVPYFNWSSPEVFIKSQLYSIYKSYELMEEYAKENNIQYDMVVKLRFDLKFEQFNITPRIIDEINLTDIIFVPNYGVGHPHPDNETSCMVCDKMYYELGLRHAHIFDHSSIICDVFAYGSQKSMKNYCSLYLHYDDMNRNFLSENLKFLNKNPNIKYTIKNNVYALEMTQSQHINSLYYLYCSYPERMLQRHLKEYMLVQSREIKMRFQR